MTFEELVQANRQQILRDKERMERIELMIEERMHQSLKENEKEA
ncbi:FbpB family small basic protein [Ornithinibacillus gellani]|nr:FbpB family small basic protein [Ornithinibacillus gellani]TQS74328.1 FbpB family small basic protein [Ornithinibacillus gellani]